MPHSRKGADLRRDPRFALHSATVDPVEGAEAQWPGEAKISGRAVLAGPVTDGPEGDKFRADIAEARALGVNGVPFFVLDRKYGISGAQPAEVFSQALAQAWAERSPLTVLSGSPDGPACGPEGCN